MLVETKCNGVSLETLVDTGACRSLLDYDAFLMIFKNQQVRFRKSVPLQSVTGHLIETLGEIDIYIDGRKIPVTVAKDQKHQLLLGMDGLKKLDAKIDCFKHSILLNGINHTHVTMNKEDFAEIYGTDHGPLPQLLMIW